MDMKAEQITQAADMLQRSHTIAQAITRLNQMDDDPLSNIIGHLGFGFEIAGPSFSPDAARQIRALMRADYQKQGADLVRTLGEMGVELPTLEQPLNERNLP